MIFKSTLLLTLLLNLSCNLIAQESNSSNTNTTTTSDISESTNVADKTPSETQVADIEEQKSNPQTPSDKNTETTKTNATPQSEVEPTNAPGPLSPGELAYPPETAAKQRLEQQQQYTEEQQQQEQQPQADDSTSSEGSATIQATQQEPSPPPQQQSSQQPTPSVESYAPNPSDVNFKEISVSQPHFQADVTEDGQKVLRQTTEELPALEMDFPDSGDITMNFPTSVDAAIDMEMGDELISVDFPDEEVRTVIRNVADLYDLNVVIPDTLVGNTSVKLRNVTWRQVFEVVLEPLGFTYVEDRNIIKIKSRDDLLQEPVDTRVFLINYAVARELQTSLAPLIDAAAGGRIQVDARTNALIVTERPSRMNDIQEIIERLDRENPQVMIESKFIEINDRNQSNLGVNWTSLSGYRISAGPFQRQYRSESGSSDINNTLNDSGQTTSNNLTVTNGVPNTVFSDTLSTTFNNAVDIATTSLTSRIDTAVFSAPAFDIVLSALETLSDSKLVTNPTLVTLDGEEAKILIGDKFPVPNYTYNDERGTFEVNGFNYEDIGIILSVRPQVNSAGFIRLDVNPQLSRQNGTVTFGGVTNSATIPIINTTETQSSVTIKDGYTLAIGGLIENEVFNDDNQIPWFGEIPVLGYLFKSESDTSRDKNLIIFITARTLNPDGSTYKDIIDPRMLMRMGITENEIPGYTLPDTHKQAINAITNLRNKAVQDRQELDYQQKLLSMEALKRAAKEAQQETEPEVKKQEPAVNTPTANSHSQETNSESLIKWH